jgi:cell division protein FtsX
MGATKAFITSPFVIECFFMGVVSVILAFVSEFAVYTLIIEKWAVEYGLTGLAGFSEYLPVLIPTFLCVGILASSLSGAICVKKYLDV